jgi:hypothetical protein
MSLSRGTNNRIKPKINNKPKGITHPKGIIDLKADRIKIEKILKVITIKP